MYFRGMADRGNGIRLFNSRESLEQIFEEFEGNENSDEENENEAAEDTAVITSQLRHFVIQVRLTFLFIENTILSLFSRNIYPIRCC